MSKFNYTLPSWLVLSRRVTFADATLTINIPADSYENSGTYYIVIAQAIPDETTINAPVVITIGDGTEEYPLLRCDGAPVVAAGLRTRTRYAVRVSTSATSGTFQLLGRICCTPDNRLAAIDGTAPA